MSEKLLNQANFKSFQPKIVQMGALQSCQIPYKPLQFCGLYMSNQSIQTLYFGWYSKSYHFAISLLQLLLFVETTLKLSWSFIWIS